MILRALDVEPVSEAALQVKRHDALRPGKARKLVSKLIIGGTKLLLLFTNTLIWGSVAASPVAMPLTILSVAGTLITGYDFLRALLRTVVGRSSITTGTLIGAATLSSLMLRENVTALIVLWLLNLGEYLEMLTLRRTRIAIRQLLSTEDDEVWLLKGEIEIRVGIDEVQAGDVVLVRSGRRIAVDGVIQSGRGYINEAPITGESMPVLRGIGDAVYAGTILLSDSIRIRVTEVGSDTVVGRLIQRVEEAQHLRPRIAIFLRGCAAGVSGNAGPAPCLDHDAGSVPMRCGSGDAYGRERLDWQWGTPRHPHQRRYALGSHVGNRHGLFR
jgi:manganese-transporting P-type ATPase C